MSANVDPDQVPGYAASDLGLHCLLRPICPIAYIYHGSSSAFEIDLPLIFWETSEHHFISKLPKNHIFLEMSILYLSIFRNVWSVTLVDGCQQMKVYSTATSVI